MAGFPRRLKQVVFILVFTLEAVVLLLEHLDVHVADSDHSQEVFLLLGLVLDGHLVVEDQILGKHSVVEVLVIVLRELASHQPIGQSMVLSQAKHFTQRSELLLNVLLAKGFVIVFDINISRRRMFLREQLHPEGEVLFFELVSLGLERFPREDDNCVLAIVKVFN